MEDIAGESNVADFAYDSRQGEFVTNSSYDQQFNGIAESFDNTDAIDFGAAFPQAQAEVGQGFVKAGFAFEGNPTSLEYAPNVPEVVLNTAFTQIVPVNGLPFTVAGGVFNFKNVLFVVPPLVITEEQLDEGLKLIDEGLAELMDKMVV